MALGAEPQAIGQSVVPPVAILGVSIDAPDAPAPLAAVWGG